MLRLTAEPGAYPLGFEVGELLTDQKAPQLFLLDGSPARAERISQALQPMAGIIEVSILVEGKFDPDSPVTDPLLTSLETWSTFGPLSVETLGRTIHAHVRRVVDASKASRGETPKEVYVTEIIVRMRGEEAPAPTRAPAELPPPRPVRRRPEPPPGFVRVVRYRDRETGAYASADKWKRSRAAKRGAAKRAGKSHAGKGRYVRVSELRRVR